MAGTQILCQVCKIPLAFPMSQEGIQDSNCPYSLCIITIPCNMPTRVNNYSRRGICHLLCCFPDQIRFYCCYAISPFRSKILYVSFQLIKS